MSEAPFDPSLLEDLRDLVGEVWSDLQADGLMLGAERLVTYTIETRTAGNAARFEAPTITLATENIVPRPLLDLRDQWRAGQRVGDGLLTIARAALAPDQIAQVAYYTIVGDTVLAENGSVLQAEDGAELLLEDATTLSTQYHAAGGWTKYLPLVTEVVVTRARQ